MCLCSPLEFFLFFIFLSKREKNIPSLLPLKKKQVHRLPGIAHRAPFEHWRVYGKKPQQKSNPPLIWMATTIWMKTISCWWSDSLLGNDFGSKWKKKQDKETQTATMTMTTNTAKQVTLRDPKRHQSARYFNYSFVYYYYFFFFCVLFTGYIMIIFEDEH